MDDATANIETDTVTPVRTLKPLRVWIPLLLLPLMVFMRFIPGLVENGPAMIWAASAFGPFLVGLVIMLWWLVLSRASWRERLLGLFGFIAVIVIEQVAADPSMRGPLMIVMTIPMAIAAFAIGAILFGSHLSMQRTWFALAMAFVAAGVSVFLKTDGIWGNFAFNIQLRWAKTSEDTILARGRETKTSIDAADLKQIDWQGFRGPNFDSSEHGTKYSDNWTDNPPKQLWRIVIGPAWSSFAVAGNYLFTQEQRGESECVVCYAADTGKQIWEHSIKSRFFESLGGLGPRATPTIADGFIYALGAEGRLLKLDATSGDLVWDINIRDIAGRKELPMWGFSASPLVDHDQVIVHAGGENNNGVIAFDVKNGTKVWSASAGVNSYGSVQVLTILGKPYLALLSDTGLHLWEPSTGEVKLDYEWKHMGYRSLQPQVIDGDKVLIPTGLGSGTRLIQLSEADGKLQATEALWTSLDMKSDFNDIVLHKGFGYGFDNSIFACIDLKDGKRKWKGGRYEKGQAFLLADSDLILVVSEKGELVLLRANPDKLEQLAKLTAMDGKSWNHPVVVGNRLYLRNSEEAVCYELPLAK